MRDSSVAASIQMRSKGKRFWYLVESEAEQVEGEYRFRIEILFHVFLFLWKRINLRQWIIMQYHCVGIWTVLLIIAHASLISTCNHCNCAHNYGSIRAYFAQFCA